MSTLLPSISLLTKDASMNLRLPIFRSSSPFSVRRSLRSSKFFIARASLPFSPQKAKHYKELEAAVDVVHRACHICVEVQKSLFSDDGKVLEKNDNTPVTIADFSVQALISLELKKQFPLIPLVAEEDSAYLRANNIADVVVKIVNDKTSFTHGKSTEDEVLDAIDRGGSNAAVFDAKPATYWPRYTVRGRRVGCLFRKPRIFGVFASGGICHITFQVLDPIDGTKGFLKGGSALYVVGLALVVDGEIVLGVMGCPKWQESFSDQSSIDVKDLQKLETKSGIIMAAHVGCGTWTASLSVANGVMSTSSFWERCFVNGSSSVHGASFCISDGQTWDSIPLSDSFSATTHSASVGDKQIILLPTSFGSLCKYMMVAYGGAAVFILRARVQVTRKVWDHAVGMICVHEAGGLVTDWEGSQLDLAADLIARRDVFPSGGVLVTNSVLHSQILELISSSQPVAS